MGNLIGVSLQAGKYTLEKEIGRGGFGMTFRARHNRLGQIVVIKTLHETWWDAPNLSELQHQFQDEARRLALCVHPNVVRVTDFFTEDNLPYMVMDYIPGRPLSDIVFPNHPLSEAEAITYIAQIGSALKAVHQNGLLHRDVKPHNIMVDDRSGEAVLIDFGIAREFSRDQTQTQTSFLSAGYAPIEQYLSRAKRTPATDVYGLAATLYSLLTAQAPIASVLRHRQPLKSPREFRPELSPVISQVVMRGMALEIDDRPASVDEWLALFPQANVKGGHAQTVSTAAHLGETAATVAVAPVYHPKTGDSTGDLSPNGASVRQLPTETVAAAERTRKGSGCGGVFLTLTMISAIVLAALGFGAYSLYQKVTQGVSGWMETITTQEGPEPNRSSQPNAAPDFPVVELPKDPTDPLEANPDETLETDPVLNSEDPGDDPADLPVDIPEIELPVSQPQPSGPLLLASTGDPANSRSQVGVSVNQAKPVRGFSPGAQESEIREYLGEPDQSGEGYWPNTRTAVYEVTPNRATLAYFYDRDTGRVRQSEAAFSQSMDRLAMRVALVNMLNGRSTEAIETALEQVRSRRLNRYTFEQGPFRGVIERNQYDQIHIQIWEADFH
ncbi:MAG: serine/threonine-protein kinase [Leptolyngbyaceae cyanobacterium MO_188.B28]|nr:serine/threonine-protein kinase [Leptolyngbyaceae cyanobacterium MO_188.B28]